MRDRANDAWAAYDRAELLVDAARAASDAAIRRVNDHSKRLHAAVVATKEGSTPAEPIAQLMAEWTIVGDAVQSTNDTYRRAIRNAKLALDAAERADDAFRRAAAV